MIINLLGVELSGYLPGNQATKYFITGVKSQKDVTIRMVTKKGNPVLYGQYCANVYNDNCFYNHLRVKNELTNNSTSLLKSNNTLQYSSLYIPDSENYCHKINKQKKVDNILYEDPCAAIAIVDCEFNQECEYAISFVGENSHILLKEK